MTGNRIPGIDAIRVLGIVAVVFGHVYTGPLTHQWIYPWHVPVFFVLTGYLWTPKRSLVKELRSRVNTLAVPYVSWLVVIGLIFAGITSLTGALDLGPIRGALRGGAAAMGPFGTFWFVSVLFFTCILYRLAERLPVLVQWAIAIAGLVLAASEGSVLSALPLGIGLALPCLVFVLAGRALRVLETHITRPTLAGWALLGASVVLIGILPGPSIDLKAGQLGVPVLGVLVAVSVSAGLILLARRIRLVGLVGKAAVSCALVGIAVVLSHPLVIWVLRSHEVQPKWILVTAVLVPWCVALVLSRTWLSRFFIGAPRATRHAPAITTTPDMVRP